MFDFLRHRGSSTRSAVSAVAQWRSAWARLLHRHRPLIVAVLAGLAVLAAVEQVTTARATVSVLAVTRDLPLGSELSTDTVRSVQVPAAVVPDGTLTRLPPDGRLTASVRSGEILTDARVGSTGLPPLPPGRAVVPVPIPQSVATWIHPGQQILLLSRPPTDPLTDGPTPRTVRATVLGYAENPAASPLAADVRTVTALVSVEQSEAALLALSGDASSLLPVFVS